MHTLIQYKYINRYIALDGKKDQQGTIKVENY